MTTVAYIANQFPSPMESYVMDEVRELRRQGIRVICCSGKRVDPNSLIEKDLEFWKETRFFQPLSDTEILAAVRRLTADRNVLWDLLKPVLREFPTSPARRLRSLGHTVMGAALANALAGFKVDHIHAHHGYFASWMALVAARLLEIDFSFTLHGSDLLLRGDLLAAKLRRCSFCVTVSEYNRRYILDNYPSTTASRVLVLRLGVDRVVKPGRVRPMFRQKRFCLLAAGRLHPVKNYSFLVRACAALRDQGLDFLCWIAGEGRERRVLEGSIRQLHLEDQVLLLGHVSPDELAGYYRHADLFVMTSVSEGLPVVLMEAMAHGKLVLAPRITGIPELIEHRRNGFLYEPGSLADFATTARWILDHKRSLIEVGQAAAETIGRSYDRQTNVRHFADQFLARLAPEIAHESPLLQQIQLPV